MTRKVSISVIALNIICLFLWGSFALAQTSGSGSGSGSGGSRVNGPRSAYGYVADTVGRIPEDSHRIQNGTRAPSAHCDRDENSSSEDSPIIVRLKDIRKDIPAAKNLNDIEDVIIDLDFYVNKQFEGPRDKQVTYVTLLVNRYSEICERLKKLEKFQKVDGTRFSAITELGRRFNDLEKIINEVEDMPSTGPKADPKAEDKKIEILRNSLNYARATVGLASDENQRRKSSSHSQSY